jgi:leucyl-tRNA synthetase
MALHDLGYLDFEEPFKRFRAHGMIIKDGAKISKSRGNVINPDDYIARFGADVLRVYLMFMGPYEAGGDFSDRGINGIVRFLDRVWQITTQHSANAKTSSVEGQAKRAMHLTIKRVTEDITTLKYNTALAALMEYLHTMENRQEVTREELQTLLILLAPFAPFLTEELWERLGNTGSIHTARWPQVDADAIRSQVITIVVQVNGRVRDRLEVPHDLSEEEIKRQAQASEKAQRFMSGQPVRKVIYVSGRLVNIVTG